MKCRTWLIGTGCFLAAAWLGGLSSPVAGQERQDEGRRSTPQARPDQAQGGGERAPGREGDAADRPGSKPENGAVLGVFLAPSRTTGARVQSVEPEGAAARAGLRAGDYIMSINDTTIERPEDVQQTLAGLAPGEEARITIWRNGQTREMTAMLGERRIAGFRGAAGGQEGRGAGGWLGMSFGESEGKIRIQNLDPNGPAAQAGLKSGDVITHVGEEKVSGADDAMNFLRDRKAGSDVWLSIVRGEEEYAIKVTMAERPQAAGSPGGREFRGPRGSEFTGESGRVAEEHRRMAERIERLEAEVQALKNKLGAGANDQNRRDRQPERQD